MMPSFYSSGSAASSSSDISLDSQSTSDEQADDSQSTYSSFMDTDGRGNPSVFSFESGQHGALYYHAHGRTYNGQNVLYRLPADDIEYSRLDKQHAVHRFSLGSLYQAPDIVQRVLQPEDGVTKRILDCGTGGGNWAIEMALEYPHAEVVGVDLAPKISRSPPPNCRFEFDDVMLGMPHYHGRFDVVHARSCANGIKSFPIFIDEMVRCLKPGGILLVAEGDLELYDERKEPIKANVDGTFDVSMARILFEAYNTMKFHGSAVDAGHFLYDWMKAHPELENERGQKVFAPVGPWVSSSDSEETRRLVMVGQLMRDNAMEFVRALKPILLEEGYAEATLDRWISDTDEELRVPSVHIYTQWHYACATKVVGRGLQDIAMQEN